MPKYTVILHTREVPAGVKFPSHFHVLAADVQTAIDYAKEDATVFCAEANGDTSLEDSLYCKADFTETAVFKGYLEELAYGEGGEQKALDEAVKFHDMSEDAKETAKGMVQFCIEKCLAMGMDEGIASDEPQVKHRFRVELEEFCSMNKEG